MQEKEEMIIYLCIQNTLEKITFTFNDGNRECRQIAEITEL